MHWEKCKDYDLWPFHLYGKAQFGEQKLNKCIRDLKITKSYQAVCPLGISYLKD